jgi:NADH:ubiquinone oxidoreductase subunit E
MDAEEKRTLELIIKKQKGKADLLGILHEVEGRYGYIPRASLFYLSEKLDVPLSTLYHLITFYRCFHLEHAEKVARICLGTTCHVKGAEVLYQEARGMSGYRVEKARCLGCCNTAPAIEIDGELMIGDAGKGRMKEGK